MIFLSEPVVRNCDSSGWYTTDCFKLDSLTELTRVKVSKSQTIHEPSDETLIACLSLLLIYKHEKRLWGCYNDIVYTSLMLFHWVDHTLGELTDLPDTYFSFLASRNYASAVGSAWESCYSIVVGIMNNIHLLPRLRVKRSNLSIWPSRDNALAILHESYRKALTVWIVNPQQFSTVFSVPDTNVILRASGKHIWVHAAKLAAKMRKLTKEKRYHWSFWGGRCS